MLVQPGDCPAVFISLLLRGGYQLELEALQDRFENTYPQDVLKWAVNEFGDSLAIVTSFGPTGIVTLHMLQSIAPQVRVLTLDTILLFDETYELIDELRERFPLNLVYLRPRLSIGRQAELYGRALWDREPAVCCHLRKTLPLRQAFADLGIQAWVTGIRRDQGASRAKTPIISRETRFNRIKLCPFATWTEEMIWGYIQAYELPYNKLHREGYPSIGCMPCTEPVDGHGYSRSGRWSAFDGKLECGLHEEEDPTMPEAEQ